MNRYALIVGAAALAVAITSSKAFAQAPAVGSPDSPDQTIVEGAGVKVGEGTVLHPSVGVETGFVDNVFYTDTNQDAAAFLRALVELNFASLSPQRLNDTGESEGHPDEGDLRWRAGLRIIGQEYLTDNDAVGAQHNIAGGANVHGLVFPQQTWRFQFDDDYIRDYRPTNFESRGNLARDINTLGLALRYQPDGRALSGILRYQNLIDVFESADSAFANRMQHTIGLRVNWQWLPITRIYGDATVGIFGGLGSSSTRTSSVPIRAIVGIQTALTVDTAINVRLGVGKGNYSSGPEPFQPIFGVQFAYRYSPNGQLTAMYSYDFTDSIQANYFRDHVFQVGENHAFGQLTVATTLDARLRDYQGVNIPNIMGPTERGDLLFDFGLSPRYYIKDWFAATLDYDLLLDSTDYRYMASGQTINPSFVRNQVMAGVRAAW